MKFKKLPEKDVKLTVNLLLEVDGEDARRFDLLERFVKQVAVFV